MNAQGENLRDQRIMFFGGTNVTVEQIEARWHEQLAALVRSGRQGFPEREGTEFIEVEDSLVATVNAGRWVALCPYCNGGIALWKENPRAACLDCGRIYSMIYWPGDKELEAGITALEARPDRHTRTWDPRIETAEELLKENELNLGGEV